MTNRTLSRSTHCVDGRIMRHDPQADDPYLETDIGKCEECDGKGCNIPLLTPYREHDRERGVIVSGKPGQEVANCDNGFGDQRENLHFIIRACNAHDALVKAVMLARAASVMDHAHIRRGMMKAGMDEGDLKSFDENCGQILARLDASLAKAKGEA